ncbi:unnamed protein product [Parascedosporium putredinis]|uniref:Uncharacterized protein n=1 Tax=Parascedosporium putredinis TaxID=1442378 RepID=A0A9P1M9C7_9PEZI|nr:unnamed protein product [Parascedosporium putredinis]CAI7990567.1 unnamed protein product [Parascedosporium putredinis]
MESVETGTYSLTGASNQASLNSASAVSTEIFPSGLDIVADGTDPIVDIVAVHGLNGHPERTWTAKSGTHWLRTLLPEDIPNAPKAINSIQRPIIFVAHSLGGIVVKSALIHSDAARRGALEEHRSVKLSTYGILFMGTPHQGGNAVQLGKLVVNIASIFVNADDHLLKHLERESEWLQQQLGQYGPISGDFLTKFAYEEYKTPTILGKSIMVVPFASAVVPGQADAEPIAIHTSHTDMVRYDSKSDRNYRKVSGELRIMMMGALEAIQQRWEKEARVNHARYEGGLGKTQLVAEYAKQHHRDYSAVFWLNARDTISLKHGFLKLAEQIRNEYPLVAYISSSVESRDLDEAVSAVKRWLDQPKNSNWLIIFDNYDTPAFQKGKHVAPAQQAGTNEPDQDMNAISSAYDIRPFLPNAYHGAILVTTRSSQVKIGHQIALRKMTELDNSLQVLASTSGRSNLHQDQGAIALAQELDGFPLALSTAGAYLSNVQTTFVEYLGRYKDSWLKLQENTPESLTYENGALYSTWNISYAAVCQRNPRSGMLLRLWAYLDNEDVWFEMLQQSQHSEPSWLQDLTRDALDFDAAIRVLCDYGLVEPDTSCQERRTESPGYSMHGCVHMWTIHVLNQTLDVEMALLASACVAGHVPKNTEKEYWVVQRRLMRHAGRCSMVLKMPGISLTRRESRITKYLGILYQDQGRLHDAEAMYDRALQGYEKALGPDHTSTLDTVQNFGILYNKQGRLDDAEAMYDRALQGYEKALGPDHISTLDTVHNLGILYNDRGRLDDAEAMYNRALQGYEKALGPDHISTLDTVHNLGILYNDQGRLDDAEAMYDRALRGLEKVLGPDHTSTLNAVHNLGALYNIQRRLDNAEAMYDRALQGREKALGPDHTSTLNTVHNLGLLYMDLDRLGDAEAMYDRALQGCEKALGPDHTSTLDTVHNLGILYWNQGRVDDSKAMYERALQGLEKALGPDHTSTLDVVHDLGILYSSQGRLGDAEAMFNRALQGREKALGPDHTSTLNVVHNLGSLYQIQGRLDEAEAMYARALQSCEKTLGSSHASTLLTARCLCELLEKQGRFDDAEAVIRAASRGRDSR